LPEPSPQEIRDILIGHLKNLYAFYGEFTGVRVARKHISWYSKGQPHGAAFRQLVNRVDSKEEQLQMTHDFFNNLQPREELAA
jgi:tRNA-dihydrouridine synthase B